MDRIPNAKHALIDEAKLTSYLLSQDHRTGRRKARVFGAALGLTMADAQALRRALGEAVLAEPALLVRRDGYGRHYTVEFTMKHARRSARVKSAWIIRSGEDFPRFVTAFVI